MNVYLLAIKNMQVAILADTREQAEFAAEKILKRRHTHASTKDYTLERLTVVDARSMRNAR